MSYTESLQIIGTYQLPVEVANYLADEDQAEDMEDALGDDLSYFVSEWLKTLPGMHHIFTITNEQTDRVPHALFSGDKKPSVTVVITSAYSNIDTMNAAFLTKPEKAAQLCSSFKEIIGNVKPEQLPMMAPQAIKDCADSFPDEPTRESVIQWAQFGSPANQLLFAMLLQNNQ